MIIFIDHFEYSGLTQISASQNLVSQGSLIHSFYYTILLCARKDSREEKHLVSASKT